MSQKIQYKSKGGKKLLHWFGVSCMTHFQTNLHFPIGGNNITVAGESRVPLLRLKLDSPVGFHRVKTVSGGTVLMARARWIMTLGPTLGTRRGEFGEFEIL